MTKLGKNFFLPFEALKNEKLIWEGGPSAKSFWAEFFAIFKIWISIFLFIWFFLTMLVFISANEKDHANVDKNNTELSKQNENIQDDTSTLKNKDKINFPTTIYIFSTSSALLLILRGIHFAGVAIAQCRQHLIPNNFFVRCRRQTYSLL